MKDYFEYRGYIGSAEVDAEGLLLVGRLLFIRDAIAYSATSISELESAFREAVDDYLATCAKYGDTPDTPCKGTFNVRVGPAVHREVALAARRKGVGLNEFVTSALKDAAQAGAAGVVQHIHRHDVTVTVAATGSLPPGTIPGSLEWGGISGTA